MKIRKLTDGSAFGFAGFQNSGTGGTITGPVILTGNPTLPLQAATKQYVDTGVTVIPAEKVISGTLPIAYFPAFTGDVAKSAGNGTISLINNGVSAGTYTRFDVDVKGRIVVGSGLTAADIPNLSWNKVINEPATLGAYGITDGLAKTGDVLTNFLTLNNAPAANLHAANKSYTDTIVSNIPKYNTADVMARPSDITPSGFLRCNGAELSKTTYSALYSVIGENFNNPIQPGVGRPWQQQYQINALQSNALSWTTHSTFTYYPGNKTAVMLKNRIHLLYVNNTEGMGYTTTVNADGTINAWSNTDFITPPTGSRLQCSLVVALNRLYLIGGYDNGVASRAETFSAPINADGTIGAWVEGPSLPNGIHGATTILTKNRLYVIGGETTAVGKPDVFTATIDENGFTSNWSTGPALPVARYTHNAAVIKDKVYIFGGQGGTGALNAIYVASINPDGTLTSWTLYGTLPVNSTSAENLVVKNKIYYFVCVNSGYVNTVYVADINADGSLGTWTLSTSLPGAMVSASVFATSSKVYMVGSLNGTGTYRCIVSNFTGGINDSAPYYNGTIVANDPNTFKLPDYSSKEMNGIYYYIKS